MVYIGTEMLGNHKHILTILLQSSIFHWNSNIWIKNEWFKIQVLAFRRDLASFTRFTLHNTQMSKTGLNALWHPKATWPCNIHVTIERTMMVRVHGPFCLFTCLTLSIAASWSWEKDGSFQSSFFLVIGRSTDCGHSNLTNMELGTKPLGVMG